MRAYIELAVEPGSDIVRILKAIRIVQGVTEAYAVTGHADIIASVDASDIKSISHIVIRGLHPIRGIATTETLLCVEETV